MTKIVPIHPGVRFGELTSTGVSSRESGKLMWEAVCDCGKSVWVSSHNLRAGSIKTCLTHSTSKSREVARTLLSDARVYPKEFGAGTKLYRAWRAMKSRCLTKTDKSFKYYGSLGVSIDPLWMDYGPFMKWSLENGFTEGLSIDRIDPAGNYTPSNCRWVTMRVQARNKRAPCAVLRAFGVEWYLADLASDPRCKVKESTLRMRIRSGWDVEKAATTPVRGAL